MFRSMPAVGGSALGFYAASGVLERDRQLVLADLDASDFVPATFLAIRLVWIARCLIVHRRDVTASALHRRLDIRGGNTGDRAGGGSA